MTEEARILRLFFPQDLLDSVATSLLAAAGGLDVPELKKLARGHQLHDVYTALATQAELNSDDGLERLAGLLLVAIRRILTCAQAPKEAVLLNTVYIAGMLGDMADSMLHSGGDGIIEVFHQKGGMTQ